MNILSRTIALTSLTLFCSSAPASEESMEKACRPLITTFFRLPLATQMAKFKELDIESKYDFYICGNQYVHPAAIYLAGPFAQEGVDAAPLLRSKLALARDDLTIRDIVFVFRVMKVKGIFDPSRDGGLLEIMDDKAANMKNKDWQRIVRRAIDEIRARSKR